MTTSLLVADPFIAGVIMLDVFMAGLLIVDIVRHSKVSEPKHSSLILARID